MNIIVRVIDAEMRGPAGKKVYLFRRSDVLAFVPVPRGRPRGTGRGKKRGGT